MILGFSIEQILLIICYLLLIFNIIKFIKNLRKKMNNKEGMENKKKTNDKELKNLEKMLNSETKMKSNTKQNFLPEPANTNVMNQYTGIARRSGEYNNRIFNKLEDQINRLLMKDYGENYMEILDRFDYLLTLKMLDNTLTVDFDNEKQMIARIEKINKYGDAKKFIEEIKNIISLEMTTNN